MTEQITPIPAPHYLSDAARAGLAGPIVRAPYPSLDDEAAWETFIAATDEQIAQMFSGIEFESSSELREVAGVPTYVVCPPGVDAETAPVHLNLHGGGLTNGGGDLVRIMTQVGAATGPAVHWAPDYRMPPRHRYPAALDDVVAVYQELLQHRDPSQIVVGGGSAGGNLAAALMLRAKADGLPMPAGLVLLTPEVDLTESGDSFQTLKDVSVGLQSLMQVNRLYADGADLADPYLSPLFGDLTGFPPTLLVSGTRDLFLSNTIRMHRRLREAGVTADLHVFDARPHAGYLNAPEEQAVQTEVQAFVKRHLAR